MSVLEKLACMRHRKDEVPNRELAKELVKKGDKKDIQEIAENLWNQDQDIASDCVKVLYEIGYLNPKLVSQYVGEFVKLLESENNRMIWGAMLTLSTIAHETATQLYEHVRTIQSAVQSGSVITQDNGIATLAIVASKNDRYRKAIFPFLLKHLETCRPKSVPQHSEKSLVAVDAKNNSVFVRVLRKRLKNLSGSQLTRVMRVIKRAESV